MSNDPPMPPSNADADLEREIRKERKFSLAEAIGRLAGPGAMKGASPVARTQQAEAEIRDNLRRQMVDPAGVLPVVLLRGVSQSRLLLDNLDRPLVALAGWVRHVLDSEYLLKELVREADMEWGRVSGERPHFERDGVPDPDDPYTAESVRIALSRLVETLNVNDT